MSRYADLILPGIFNDPAQFRQFDRDLLTALGGWSLQLKGILDRGISFNDNVDSVVVSFTSNGVANTEDTIAHTLGKVPTYFLVASLDKGAVIYKGTTAFTATNIYVKSTVASTAVKLILL